jgi:hypothetical protein
MSFQNASLRRKSTRDEPPARLPLVVALAVPGPRRRHVQAPPLCPVWPLAGVMVGVAASSVPDATSRKDANTDRTGTQYPAGAAPGSRRLIRHNRKSSRRLAVTSSGGENPAPESPIAVGAAVLVALQPATGRPRMTEEGVVIQIVAAGARSSVRGFGETGRSSVTRYVVQCWDRRVLRAASGLRVVAP